LYKIDKKPIANHLRWKNKYAIYTNKGMEIENMHKKQKEFMGKL